MKTRSTVLFATVMLLARAGHAQSLPAGPVTTLDGRLTVGAEIVGTIGPSDEPAYFNYTDYEHSAFRLFRVSLAAVWRPAERIALVGEVRSENLDDVRPYAAYLRVRPVAGYPIDIQVGRIPPAFGAFGRRGYNSDQTVIGYPLAYQYLTPLRPDAIPGTVEDLLRMRARGWRTAYPVGSPEQAPGIPVISAFKWDTGVQAHWARDIIEVTGALTVGTLGDPRLTENNDGRQLSGRAAVHPLPGLIVGGSAARGEWLDRDVTDLLPSGNPHSMQTALGADVEYSRDYWLVRGELVWSRWRVPFAASAATTDLTALATWIEGRYRFTPRVFVAGRLDRLGFSSIATDGVGGSVTWDAPVTRVEANVGYYLQRNLVARLAIQHNERDGGRVKSRTYVAGQMAYWF